MTDTGAPRGMDRGERVHTALSQAPAGAATPDLLVGQYYTAAYYTAAIPFGWNPHCPLTLVSETTAREATLTLSDVNGAPLVRLSLTPGSGYTIEAL